MSSISLWNRFQSHFLRYDDLGVSLDISRMDFADDFLSSKAEAAKNAVTQMLALEKGAIANPDEHRMVGHYWLRDSSLAPTKELADEIENTKAAILGFAADVHSGKILSSTGKKFTDLLLVGIGGSALGPQLVADSLWSSKDPIAVHFFDNTDPDGMEKVVEQLGKKLETTLVAVVSKSGGTKESRNGMLVAQDAIKKAGLDFPKHFVAVTGEGSELDKVATAEGWLKRFPMWDWVGGRTSVMSAVGLLPMALQGLDVEAFLAGAKAIDAKTRTDDLSKNASLLLALMWWHAGGGRGAKDMVVLPYKDRLLLFSRYLQQLVMESLGKELDLNGNVVNQGIAVYGNKGSTDQHAYVQQLRDGVNNFFITFVEVRKASPVAQLEVEPGVESGDYLQGFLRGTRTALHEKGRESITVSIPEFNAFYLGVLIGLYERAVGFYGTLVNINAYHQPGVEAGKKAAARVLELQAKTLAYLADNKGKAFTADQIAAAIGADAENVFHVARHIAANKPGVVYTTGANPGADTVSLA
ncbi:glucose-6-phosphate isomerase [Terrimicrobium sacchariphilum]|uniref:Glucose-6-phosphate isomerase n=1 Tax=Terrimicrobium sacchariphilum TaxID=690879 RepID=A0A146GAY3_TERSA|nr:glucose-6-phosphate isomerase [Terrimicrobium sacchariphilum]GAT33716.1 glucose-6-phosphate isomerase [Terrimicrobium sacchariphilum]